ncbi:MAG: hypothetical protein AAB152_00415 [Candidatus Coatesbacteria bacterium]
MRRVLVFLWLAVLTASPGARAAAPSIISNLANPAIGVNGLFLCQGAPDLDQAYGMRPGEAEISVISTVDPYWTLTVYFVLDAQSALAEEAFATTTKIPGVTLKLGQLRASFGKHGLLHTHAFPFVQAPVISVNTLGEEGFKDAGAEAAWMTPLPWFCELTLGAYQALPADPDHALDFGAVSRGNMPGLAHLKNLVDVDDDTTLEVGGSAIEGLGSDGMHHAVWGADLTVRNVPLRQSNERGWTVQAEFLHKEAYGGGVYDQEAFGWYGSLQYRWAQTWWTGVRVQEAYRSFTDTLLDSTGTPEPGYTRGASANISYLPSEFSQIRLEYSALRATGVDGSRALDRRLMLQFSFIIGFHALHAY